MWMFCSNQSGTYWWNSFFQHPHNNLALMDLLSFRLSTSISNNYFWLEFQLTPQAISKLALTSCLLCFVSVLHSHQRTYTIWLISQDGNHLFTQQVSYGFNPYTGKLIKPLSQTSVGIAKNLPNEEITKQNKCGSLPLVFKYSIRF